MITYLDINQVMAAIDLALSSAQLHALAAYITGWLAVSLPFPDQILIDPQGR